MELKTMKIVELEGLSGDACRIYSVRIGDDDDTLFEQFLETQPKNIRRWQDSPILTSKVEQLHNLSLLITEAIKEKDITISESGMTGQIIMDPEQY